MRQHKYRGKLVDNGEWVYGYLMNIHNPKRLFVGQWNFIGGEATIKDELFSGYDEVHPETVGQFTGLTDKNGVEIYEGDLWQGIFSEEHSKTNDKTEIKGVVLYLSGCPTLRSDFSSKSFDELVDAEGDTWVSWRSDNCIASPKRYSYYSIREIEVIGNIHEGEI